MTYTDLCFFNHWHYGDLFTTRELVKDMSRQLPHLTTGYIHKLDTAVIDDFAHNYDAESRQMVLNKFHMSIPMLEDEQNVLINTWVGNYQSKHFASNKHPSYVQHHGIFGEIYDIANRNFGWNLVLDPDVWHYVPEIDYSKLDLAAADRFLDTVTGNLYLFSNGKVQSEQSSLQHMNSLIDTLAAMHPQDTFLATESYVTDQPNVKFTADIFNLTNDLREISYLSTRAQLIVGRNSGPFTYANTRGNLTDANKLFMCYSHDARDVLPYGLDIACDFRFSDCTDNDIVATQIDQAITDIKQGVLSSGFKNI